MNKNHILIIEDEVDIQELIKYHLQKEGYSVSGFTSGKEGLDAVKVILPDLILLDLMLFEIDGIEICRRIKSDPETKNIPVILITAKSDDSDIVVGLEVGADDYITKPFSPKVLIARIRTLFRRFKAREIKDKSVLQVGDLVINPGKFQVLIENKPVILTFSQFQILYQLAGKPGWVFTREQLIDATRGEDTIITDRSIDVQIVGLRKKLGKAGGYIETVRGIGYRFKEYQI